MSEKHLGEIEVFIDGVLKETVREFQNPFPLLDRIPIYRNLSLTNGPHQVKIVSKAPAGKGVTFDGFRVYSDSVAPRLSESYDCHFRGT